MRSAEEFVAVRAFIAAGAKNCAIARHTGVPRSTVRDWRRRPQVGSRHVSESPCGTADDFYDIPAAAYCDVLGLYLGDGYVSRSGRVWRRVYQFRHWRVSAHRLQRGTVDGCPLHGVGARMLFARALIAGSR